MITVPNVRISAQFVGKGADRPVIGFDKNGYALVICYKTQRLVPASGIDGFLEIGEDFEFISQVIPAAPGHFEVMYMLKDDGEIEVWETPVVAWGLRPGFQRMVAMVQAYDDLSELEAVDDTDDDHVCMIGPTIEFSYEQQIEKAKEKHASVLKRGSKR